jgi:hypothetical protein
VRSVLSILLIAGGSAWAWPPHVFLGPRLRTVEVSPQQIVRFASASARDASGELTLRVKDISAIDSAISGDEVTEFAAGSDGYRFASFRVATVSPDSQTSSYGGGVISNGTVGELTVGGGALLPARFVDLAAFGTVDVLDASGGPVAPDRTCVVEIAGGEARLTLLGIDEQGRPQPFLERPTATFVWKNATLGDPSGPVDRLTDESGRSLGGMIELRALDATDDESSTHPDGVLRIMLALQKPDGSSIVISRLMLDGTKHGGVLLDGLVDGAQVSMALWGRCDVTDRHGASLAKDVPIAVTATADGVVHVRLEGMIDVVARGAIVK